MVKKRKNLLSWVLSFLASYHLSLGTYVAALETLPVFGSHARVESLGQAYSGDIFTSLGSASATVVSAGAAPGGNGVHGMRAAGMGRFGQTALGISVFGRTFESENILDHQGNPVGNFKNSELAVHASFGRALSNVNCEVGFGWARSKIFDTALSKWGVSASVIFRPHSRFSLGAGWAWKDIRTGAALTLLDFDPIKLRVLADLAKPPGSGARGHYGGEITFNEHLILRAGRSGKTGTARFGLGVSKGKISMDGSFETGSRLSSNPMNFSVAIKLH